MTGQAPYEASCVACGKATLRARGIQLDTLLTQAGLPSWEETLAALKAELPPTAEVFASAKGFTQQQMAHFKGKYGLPSMTHSDENAGVARLLATYPQVLDPLQ